MTIFKGTPKEKTFTVQMDNDTILELTDETHVEIHAENNKYQAAWMDDSQALAFSPVITEDNLSHIADWIEALPAILPEGVDFTESDPVVIKI